MKSSSSGLALLALLALGSPVLAGETRATARPPVKPLRWWVLPLKDPAFPMPGRPPLQVLRNADEAAGALTTQPPTMDGGPRRPPAAALPSGIDWDDYMLVVIAGEGGDGAARDVVSLSSDGTEILIRAMKEEDAGVPSQSGEAIVVLVTRSELPVRVAWSDGKLAAMRQDRDCTRDESTHRDVRKPGELCSRCGTAKTASPKAKLCAGCAAELQECPYCGKRVSGPIPLRN